MPEARSPNASASGRAFRPSPTMGEERQFRVASRCELLPFLIGIAPGLSRKQAKDLLRFRAVTVERKTNVRHDTKLEPGDVVTIAGRKRVRADSLERHNLRIVHLDDAIIVVDKPTGLLS